MKKWKLLGLLPALVLASPTWADQEIEIEFRLQPDGSGAKTRNQGINIEDNEVEIYLDGDERELDSSQVDIEGLFQLVTKSIQSFEIKEGGRIRAPYTEVKMEYSGEDREIEISIRYPEGQMPAVLIKLQEDYLDEVWR